MMQMVGGEELWLHKLIDANVRPASVQTGKNCITMYETSLIDVPSMSQNQSGSINLPSNATETTRINVDQCLQKGLKKKNPDKY